MEPFLKIQVHVQYTWVLWRKYLGIQTKFALIHVQWFIDAKLIEDKTIPTDFRYETQAISMIMQYNGDNDPFNT